MSIIDILILIFIYFCCFYKKWKLKGKDALFVRTLMYIYLILLIYVTLMPIVTSLPFLFNHPYIPMNLNIFDDLINGRGDYFRQIILNIIMTIPFGFLLPIINKKSMFLKTILCTFLLSLCIELLQPLIDGARSSDITDLITNTIGGAVGYVCFLVLKPVVNKVMMMLKR